MLFLVKHALPILNPDLPPSEWNLSDQGRKSGAPLARQLAERLQDGSTRLAASREPKAAETARLVGSGLKLPVEFVDGLHEHERPAQPLLSQAQFHAQAKNLFDRPGEQVFGLESADQAHARFERAVMGLLSAASPASRENLVIFSHGTVISLFVSRRCPVDGFSLWKRLGLPSFVTLTLNADSREWAIHEIVDTIPDEEP